VTVEQTCPRCGEEFSGTDPDEVANAVIDHAAVEHQHRLDRHVVLAHLQGVHPYDVDP
jgi:hypothetical protein